MRQLTRVYHTWDKWESFPAGFYNAKAPNGWSAEQAKEKYRELLADIPEFERVMGRILEEWPNSVEHNLTNPTLNRIAWMGQAALAYKYGIPSSYRGGYFLLTKEQQYAADMAALKYINLWMERQQYPTLEYTTARAAKVKQTLY